MGLTSFGWSRPTASRCVQGRGFSGSKTSSAGVDGNVKTANSGVQGPGWQQKDVRRRRDRQCDDGKERRAGTWV
jgi:hypothetical protein